MSDLRRTGPRVTVCMDFNLQFLRPKFHGHHGVYYLHLGWFTAMVTFGKKRDTFYDMLDSGLDARESQRSITKKKEGTDA